MAINLTKLNVARRQLAVAIRLFFDGRDPVSVYTLATNAWEIVDVLCENRGVDSLSKQSRENIPVGKLLKRDYINRPFRNFFKHADNDPEGTVGGFSDDENDHILILAVEDLIRLEQPALCECHIFQVWCFAVYEEKLSAEGREQFLPDIRKALPDIRRLPRSERKRMGRKLLHSYCKDKQSLKDLGADMSEWNRWGMQSS